MIIGGKVRLRAKRLSDARNDYQWQTNLELVQLDATPPLTISFSQYLFDYTSELRYPTSNRHIFALETFDGKHIGNCVYYNVDGKKGEVELGIMIGDRDYWEKGYGTDTVATLVKHIFLRTDLNRIYLKTLNWNLRAQKCFLKNGFTPNGNLIKDGHDFVLMQLYREEWEERRKGEGKAAG